MAKRYLLKASSYANLNNFEISPYLSQNGKDQQKEPIISTERDVRKGETS